MKILFVNHTFPPQSYAGSELCVLSLAKQLQTQGHKVAVFYRYSDQAHEEYQLVEGAFDGITTYKVNQTYRFTKKFQDIYVNPIIAAHFAKLLREFQADIVHFHHLTNLSLSMVQETKVYGAKIVFTLHDYWLLCQRGQLLKEDLSLCSGPSDAGCRLCLSKQLLRGWQQKITSQIIHWKNNTLATISLTQISPTIHTSNPSFTGRTSFGLGELEGSVLLAHPPTEMHYTLSFPQASRLKTAIAMHPVTYNQAGQGVLFEILLNGETLFKQLLNPKQNQSDQNWHEVDITLPPQKMATLIFKTTAQAQDDNQHCTAGWKNPEIILLTAETNAQTQLRKPALKQWATTTAQWITWLSPDAHNGIQHRKHWAQQVFEDVDLFISPSKFLRQFFIKHGLPAEKIIYSDNGFVIPKTIQQRKTRSPIQFGYIGTWIPSKGVDLAIKAFQSIDPTKAQLHVYGFFPGYDGFEHYEDELKLMAGEAVVFQGKYDPAGVYDLLAGLDCLIMPSIWWENSPMTIHEAFIAKVPLITADVGGMAEQVRNGGGLTFRHRDASDLQRVIQQIIQDPSILNDLRDTIPNVKSIQVQVQETLELYQNLLQPNRQHLTKQ